MRKKVVLVILLVIFTFGAGLLNNYYKAMGQELGLASKQTSMRVPVMGFNGFIANVAFLHTQTLKKHKRYNEIPAWASFIVKLQPDMTQTTLFWAHELSFNISRMYDSYALRWRWVKHGIELLRDVAIKSYNDPIYHYEIARFYRLRVGETVEPADLYFKTVLATEMMNCLGSYHLTQLARGLREFPTQKYEINLDKTLAYVTERGIVPHFPQLTDEQFTEFELFVRRKLIEERFGLNLEKTVQLEEKFGELDWRLPEALTVYWAYSGLLRAKECGETDTFKYHHLLYSVLGRSVNYGTLLYFNDDGELQLAPNFQVVESLLKFYEETLKLYPERSERINQMYRAFLNQALGQSFAYGRHDISGKIYSKLRDKFNEKGNYEELALAALVGQNMRGDYRTVQTLIGGLYTRMFEFLAVGDVDKAVALEETAKKMYNYYVSNENVQSFEKGKIGNLQTIKSEVLKRLLGGNSTFIKNSLKEEDLKLKRKL